ncbi:MAG: hypothetical protein ACK55Z_16300, partial [bacterium]
NGGLLTVGSTSAQFVVAFQEGFDGVNPATPIYKGADITSGNSQGFDLSTAAKSGSVAYAKHIAALSNADEFEMQQSQVNTLLYNENGQLLLDFIPALQPFVNE